MKHIYKATLTDALKLSSILREGMQIEVSAEMHKYLDGGKWYDCYYVYINGEETRFTKKLVDNLISNGALQ